MRTLTMHGANVTVFSAKEQLFAAAADDFFRVVRQATGAGRDCTVALAGGSTPKALYRLIAERAAREPELKSLDWQRVQFYFGDERCVPPDYADSNYGMAKGTLLANGLVPEANLHRVRTELPPADSAQDYEDRLHRQFSGADPQFDLILLGMGPDGHTASLFPGTKALNERERLVVANHVPRLNAERVTFTFRTLDAAQHVLFLVAGEDKREAIKQVLVEKAPLPSGQVHPRGPLDWYLDEAAAAFLPH